MVDNVGRFMDLNKERVDQTVERIIKREKGEHVYFIRSNDPRVRNSTAFLIARLLMGGSYSIAFLDDSSNPPDSKDAGETEMTLFILDNSDGKIPEFTNADIRKRVSLATGSQVPYQGATVPVLILSDLPARINSGRDVGEHVHIRRDPSVKKRWEGSGLGASFILLSLFFAISGITTALASFAYLHSTGPLPVSYTESPLLLRLDGYVIVISLAGAVISILSRKGLEPGHSRLIVYGAVLFIIGVTEIPQLFMGVLSTTNVLSLNPPYSAAGVLVSVLLIASAFAVLSTGLLNSWTRYLAGIVALAYATGGMLAYSFLYGNAVRPVDFQPGTISPIAIPDMIWGVSGLIMAAILIYHGITFLMKPSTVRGGAL